MTSDDLFRNHDHSFSCSSVMATVDGTVTINRRSKCFLLYFYLSTVSLFSLFGYGEAVLVPDSNCYAINNNSRLLDFTDWIGHPFEYIGKDADVVVRFCKDVESRSQAGYVDFGHYSPFNSFTAGSDSLYLLQEFFNGDLSKCEQSYDKMGRTAQVNILCGNCLHGVCEGDRGCICDVTYDASSCRVFIELAIPCVKDGPRIFKGFTVGFHPRSWEVVYNGLTRRGFGRGNQEFSFGSDQEKVFLYITAISSLSGLVGKPSFKVSPNTGLDVRLSGSGANGHPPTTLSPTILSVDWRCVDARESPYEVAISIPVDGYDPVEFTLTKVCEYKQQKEGDSIRGWATFGVVSCAFIVLATFFCCGGFIYRVYMEQQHGIDALPGITILSACLETLSGPQSYRQQEDAGNFTNRSSEGYQRTAENKRGAI